MLRKNDIIELNITSLTSDGDGVGRAGELVFFVPNTAVGDVIDVRRSLMQSGRRSSTRSRA